MNSNKIIISKDYLYHKYIELGISTKDIAKEYGCSCPTILNNLRYHLIPIRNGSAAHNTPLYTSKLKQWTKTHSEDYYSMPENPIEGQLVSNKVRGLKSNGSSVWVICPSCKQGRWIKCSDAKKLEFLKYCISCMYQSPEFKERDRKAQLLRYGYQTERDKTGIHMRKFYKENPEHKEKQGNQLRSLKEDPIVMTKWSKSLKETMSTPKHKEKLSKRFKSIWQRPGYKEKMKPIASARTKKVWDNYTPEQRDEAIRMQILGTHRRPNKPEQQLIDLLNTNFPSEWKYTGDGQVIMSGRNPDFVNINGKKLVIECFGDYWHSKKHTGRDEADDIRLREEAYASYGFKTLVVWQAELKDQEKVLERIAEFMK
jgi:G:T-mismatch repair DNA endonuclease (very short patch repair protein)